MSLLRLTGIALASGVAGWALEYALSGTPPYSQAFSGAHVPLLPVYAAGGLAVALLAPKISRFPWYGRATVYAGALTAVEAAAGLVDRADGNRSWDYAGQLVDVPHALAWGALGLGAERLVRMGG
jgi:hypothetical protein